MSLGPVTFDAHSSAAGAISTLFVRTLVICGLIGVVVTALVAYCIYRFRARPGDAEPAQIHGHTRLEVAWTVVPFLIVIGLAAMTVQAVSASDPPPTGEPELVVVGHQWWWEVRYRSGAITANEIHLPVGRRVLTRIEAADVIHDFWVPQLARKIDAVPGHPVSIWLEADAPGTYEGACAEFCGAQHAWMRLLVIAQEPAAFAAWEARERAPALAVAAGSPEARGAALYLDRTCVKCHAIGGLGDQSRVAPDLTHLASRRTLGAGLLTNTPENLARWLLRPQELKPASHMPDLHLSTDEVRDLVAYFETLR